MFEACSCSVYLNGNWESVWTLKPDGQRYVSFAHVFGVLLWTTSPRILTLLICRPELFPPGKSQTMAGFAVGQHGRVHRRSVDWKPWRSAHQVRSSLSDVLGLTQVGIVRMSEDQPAHTKQEWFVLFAVLLAVTPDAMQLGWTGVAIHKQ